MSVFDDEFDESIFDDFPIDDSSNHTYDFYSVDYDSDEQRFNEKHEGPQLLSKIAMLEGTIADNNRIMAQMEYKIKNLEKKIHLLKHPAHKGGIDIQSICEMYQNGCSQSHIAKQMKCSRGTVKSRLIEKGLIK